jgi:hypothetical protein
MSRVNKVNKGSYVQRGRLTPDDMARERMNQAQVSGRGGKKDVAAKASTTRAARTSKRRRTGPDSK